MATIDELIAVMQAYKEGKEIEFSYKGVNSWSECKGPSWDWTTYDYRIKPQKKKIKFCAWLANGQLRYITPYNSVKYEPGEELIKWTRLPALDLETEVEE